MGVDPGGNGGGGIYPPNILGGGGVWPVLSSPQYFTIECYIIPAKYLKYNKKNNERNSRFRM